MHATCSKVTLEMVTQRIPLLTIAWPPMLHEPRFPHVTPGASLCLRWTDLTRILHCQYTIIEGIVWILKLFHYLHIAFQFSLPFFSYDKNLHIKYFNSSCRAFEFGEGIERWCDCLKLIKIKYKRMTMVTRV